tara:strand:- start:295 stop:855 length:561 start_codon:yes stop_codon:yes gene_type:complete
MKRAFDIVLSIILIAIFFGIFILIFIAVRLTSKGPGVYWSDRIGLHSKIFKMPKFRSMLINTPNVATHLLENPEEYISPIGRFLRRYSLDELPQLISVLKGDMSFVGPRPALYNQKDLIELRTQYGVDKVLPGITGWAQVRGRDDLSLPDKVALDKEYIKYKSFWFDIKILLLTFLVIIKRSGVSH